MVVCTYVIAYYARVIIILTGTAHDSARIFCYVVSNYEIAGTVWTQNDAATCVIDYVVSSYSVVFADNVDAIFELCNCCVCYCEKASFYEDIRNPFTYCDGSVHVRGYCHSLCPRLGCERPPS